MKLATMDINAYLDAFGVDVVVKGQTHKAILRDEYAVTEVGRIRISTNAPEVQLATATVTDLGGIPRDTVVDIAGVGYLAKEVQPDTYGNFTNVRLVEPS